MLWHIGEMWPKKRVPSLLNNTHISCCTFSPWALRGLVSPCWPLQLTAGPPNHLLSQWNLSRCTGPAAQADNEGWPAWCAGWGGNWGYTHIPCLQSLCTCLGTLIVYSYWNEDNTKVVWTIHRFHRHTIIICFFILKLQRFSCTQIYIFFLLPGTVFYSVIIKKSCIQICFCCNFYLSTIHCPKS